MAVGDREEKRSSEAALLLERAREMPRTAWARRTVVQEQVVMSSGPDGDGCAVIDG